MVPVVAGSSPVRHPPFWLGEQDAPSHRAKLLGARPRSSADRAGAFEAPCGGSIPPGAIVIRRAIAPIEQLSYSRAMGLRAIVWATVSVSILAVASVSGARAVGASGSRWTSRQAETTISTTIWPDHRIVVGQTCVGIDPVRRGTAELSTQLVCLMNVFLRPSRIPLKRWDSLGSAFRRHDIPAVYALLGVPAGSDVANVNAAAARWGLRTSHPRTVGVAVSSASAWMPTRPALSVREFGPAVRVRHQLLAALPAVEAYYVEHGTYAGLSVTKLRKIDANVSAALKIVVATKLRYCVQLGAPTWFARGPYAAVNLGHC